MDKEDRKELNKQINDLIQEAKLNRKNFIAPYKNKFENLKKDEQDLLKELSKLKRDTLKLTKELTKLKKRQAEIIIELIQLEPSHLSETWILSEIIEWLRRYDCIDYLKEAFISKGKRKRPTERQRAKDVLDKLLVKLVDSKYNKAKGKISKDRIFADLSIKSEDHIFLGLNEKIEDKSIDYDLEAMYKKRYYSCKEKEKSNKKGKDNLPCPYYGLDISIDRGVLDMMFHRK